MVLDFTPQEGDQVGVFGYRGAFVVRERKIGTDGHYLFRLESLYSGLALDNVRYPMMTYSDEEKVRKVLPQILAECRPWPEDFQSEEDGDGLSYDIRSDEMHDGTPRVLVSFLLKPDAKLTTENARIGNEFYTKLREQFQFVSIDSWLQFTAKEERSILRAAS
jgi:hypothetical protein